jgi:alpha-tubulin suppressor-like RCC1 family protein
VPSSAMPRRLIASTTVALISLGGLGATTSSASADGAEPGTVIAWGFNNTGQADVPAGLQDKVVTAVSSGYQRSLALTSDGTVTAWGGRGDDVPASLGGQVVTAVAAGWVADMVLTSDGKVTVWGDNGNGQLDVPASLDGKTVTAITMSQNQAMALTSDGKVTAWGGNADGETDIPASLDGKTVTAIDASRFASMALTSDGKVTVWGYPGYGQQDIPASLDDATVTAISTGDTDCMALTSDGTVVSWGYGYAGQTDVPASLDGKTVTAISDGFAHELALTSDGTVFAWGDGQVDATSVPTGLHDVTQISAGFYSNLVIGDISIVDFGTGVTATVSGTPEVGSSLTAGEGEVAPTADSLSYRWFADDVEISGATASTFTPTSDLLGAKITVEVTAAKAGYNDSTDVSDPTAAVGAGTIAATGSVTVSGTAQVGSTLTGTSTVETTPEADTSGQWLRDGVAIDGATGTTYDVTNADAGTTITYQVTATLEGYDDATYTSDGVGPVDGGVITLPTPTVTGDPVVDGTLTASLPGSTLDPADADVSYEWTRSATVVGTGSAYSPTAADAGETLTVTATAAKSHFDDATSSTQTAEVTAADFASGPTATITGTLKVGQILTADGGVVAPTPDNFEYQWYADDAAIDGADASTFTLTPAQKQLTISVQVTAVRAGYTSLSDRSANTAGVATNLAPTLDLQAASSSLRRGQSTRLTWSSTEATGLVASGGWSGVRNDAGTVSVRPTSLGGTTYVLTATNDIGTTTAQVSLQVTRPVKALGVLATRGLRLRGTKITVATQGLGAAEPFTIRVAGTTVATGQATEAGRVNRTVTIPTGTHEGNVRVTVTGSESDRTGTVIVRVARNKSLGLRLAKREVRASDDQRVTVTGLARGEKVTVTYQGKRMSPKRAHANGHGRYAISFDVDIYWGTKSVKAIGQYSGRKAVRTFEVVRRCHVGHVCA